MLHITKKQDQTLLTVELEGRLDTTTAPDLEKELKENMDSIDELVLDFAKLEYISSAGLRVLLSSHKAMAKKGGMKVIHVREEVREIFEVTGFLDFLTVE